MALCSVLQPHAELMDMLRTSSPSSISKSRCLLNPSEPCTL